MMRNTLMRALALALLLPLPAYAGGYGEKCTASTQECLDKMAAKMRISGWVGLELDKDATTGAYSVKRVVAGSPAENVGIQPGDVLFALNGIEINESNSEALKKAKADWAPGQSVTYTIKRDGRDRKVQLTLAPMPADVLARFIGEHMLEHAAVEMAKEEAR